MGVPLLLRLKNKEINEKHVMFELLKQKILIFGTF